MNRKELVSRVASVLRENNVRKPIRATKQVFHISDDEGNSKDFVIRKTDKNVIFTADDVDAVIGACLSVIEDSIKRGEPITFRGFGTLGLKYRKPRSTKIPGTNEWVDISGRYIPKFDFGSDLRMCAKVYELSTNDKLPDNYRIPDESELKAGD